MITGIKKKVRTSACDKRLKGKKQIFDLDKATEENWEEYKAKLDNSLKEKLDNRKKEKSTNTSRLKALSKDEIQDLISSNIIKYTRATLLGKKVYSKKLIQKRGKILVIVLKRPQKNQKYMSAM